MTTRSAGKSLQPVTRLSSRVHEGEHVNGLVKDEIDDEMWKPAHSVRATNVLHVTKDGIVRIPA